MQNEAINLLSKDEKIQAAIRILEKKVPDIDALLSKLATMSEKKPFNFNIAILQLRNMKL